MHWTILFDIPNRQEDYAKCLELIENISNRTDDGTIDEAFLENVCYISAEKELSFLEIIKGQTVLWNQKIPEIKQEDNVKYVFYVDCSDENDMINIIYFCQVNDVVKGNCILCIKSVDEGKNRANITDLLSELLITGEIKDCYTLIDNNYKRVNTNKVRILKRFSPIYKIDEEENSVEYWRQSVHSFLLKLYKEMPVGGNEYQYTKNYFLPHIVPDLLKNRYPNDIEIKSSDNHDRRLMKIFLECFCTQKNSKKDFVEKRYEIWKSKELFAYIKDMPLLAMYILCVLDYFRKNQENDSMEEIKQEIFEARDMADGLLQILENVYHSENKCGYFCFRVHKNKKDNKNKYLEKQYAAFMEKIEEIQGNTDNYLEFKIVDYSHYSIPEQFYQCFVKRMDNAEEEEKQIYEQLLEQAQKIEVLSFFSSSDFWYSYNSISENVVHHYGLQIFESLVACYEGYFRVRSSGKYQLKSEKEIYSTIEDEPHSMISRRIPGTQYEILLPFRMKKVPQNISLNVNINYTNNLLKQYEVYETINFTSKYCTSVYEEIRKKEINRNISYQEMKEKTIQELAVRLQNDLQKVTAKNPIIHFSAEKISLTMVEMFCKAIMLYIAQKPIGDSCYIMITECSQAHFIEITRMMALFYDKQGMNQLMKDTQLFMSGQKEGEEFLIYGNNLGEAIGSTEKLAFARCIHPDCLKTLKKMLKNHSMGKSPNDIVSIVPFDMIKYDESKETLFERSLQKVLNQDVQTEKFGCKLEDLHVKIGSKIHIRTFYEAELLFHNNYYTSRFAYWLLNELSSNKELDLTKRFVLVGYENYSEMLLNELCNMFGKNGIQTDYLIYEQKAVGKFRGREPLSQYKDCQFVIIVPINSTVTTHIKAAGFLEKTIKEELKKENYENYSEYHLGKVWNYGIVLISDKKENQYWKKSLEEQNTIISTISNEKMKYYTEVISEWAHPLKCKACFPENDYTKEVPLVETNKESVVPMHAISIKKERRKIDRHKINEEEEKKLEELSEFLIYKHVERNGNHFNYYFSTEKLWDFPKVRKNVQEWLKQKKALFQTRECKVYDIIVAPLHFSNTAFVEEVNTWLFSNAALVLHFDVDKEFRMNVKTKYSSVQQLYDNLCMDDEKSVINFHYVDDTIISGHTYNRMKSLIMSLITRRENRNVEIHIFKSIVLLLNRMSPSSIQHYIEEPDYFMAYFNLNISSMRVNSDACVLCKKHKEWNSLAEQAALNEIYEYWKKKSRKIECKKIEQEEESLLPGRQKRAKQYMIASHRAKSLLDVVCVSEEIDVIQKMIVEYLFPKAVEQSLEELIAVLKVLGRPFLIFRREAKEAVFGLMLTMLDELLRNEEPAGEGKLYDILRMLWRNQANRTKIITMLVNRLAEMGANYLIRKRSMNCLMSYCIHEITDEQESRCFASNYLNRVKQLVGQGNDFTKGLYLEYLLLYGEEYQSDFCDKPMIPLAGSDRETAFKRNVYLENTKLANYGIEYLADCFTNGMDYTKENFMEALNENYYFDNFIQYLSFHKQVEMDEMGKIKEFSSEGVIKQLEGMVRFQLLYQKIFGEWKITGIELEEEEKNLKNKFEEMLKCLTMAAGALDGEIIVPYRNPENGEKFIALGLGKSAEIRRLKNKEQKVMNFMKEHSDFEGNTYAICAMEDDKKWILLKFYDGTNAGNEDIPIIYMLFPFDIKDDGEILHALKNILIFRNKIWKILNLSSSTLLQNWTDNLFYKQQMLKSRAVGHSELDTLVNQIKEVSDIICDKEDSDMKGSEQTLYRKYFELLVNNLIGFMNSQVLGGNGKNFMMPAEMTFMKFWNGEKKTIQAAETIWKLEVKLKDEEHLQQYAFRKGTEKVNWTPAPDALRILFLAILQNAKKHGIRDREDKIVIMIYVEGNDLCIANRIDSKVKPHIEREICSEAYRSGEGISQAVIFDICQNWYRPLHYEELFALKEEKNNDNQWCYVVKLPIIRGVNEE